MLLLKSARGNVNIWFDETLLSRLDNKAEDAIIIVMQRLHVDDLAGHVLRHGNWTHLNLPAIAEVGDHIPIGPDETYYRKAGELLQPEREPSHVLQVLKTSMGSAAFSAQYQQQPVPPGDNMIQWKWFQTYKTQPDKETYTDKIVQSWDTASKATQLSDYSVGITALMKDDKFYILDVVRERLEYPALKKRIIYERNRWDAEDVLIEDKGSGMGLIQDLKYDNLYPIAISPFEDKITRMSTCSSQIEAGRIVLPESASWLPDFKTELMAFPDASHDDQADALSQLINWDRNRSDFSYEYI
jgi:predicted phage terminase large subunit-like protein